LRIRLFDDAQRFGVLRRGLERFAVVEPIEKVRERAKYRPVVCGGSIATSSSVRPSNEPQAVALEHDRAGGAENFQAIALRAAGQPCAIKSPMSGTAPAAVVMKIEARSRRTSGHDRPSEAAASVSGPSRKRSVSTWWISTSMTSSRSSAANMG
jgi:hypothetical protein